MTKLKLFRTIALVIIPFIVLILFVSSMYIVKPNEACLVLQFGKVVDTVTETGIHFKAPFIQKVKKFYTGEQIYDMSASDVITSDKKSMIADCYTTWRIDDPLKFYQTLSSSAVAESRIDVTVYNAMKNVISSTTQEKVISGKDGSLDKEIMSRIDKMNAYGISILDVEMKLLDLPSDNKDAVYKRMISERKVIAAGYKAEGDKEAKQIKNNVDSQVRIILSDSKTKAAKLEASGEAEYYKILADAYQSSDSAKAFYNYIIGLNALEKSLAEGGTIIVDKDSPLYEVLVTK